MSLLQSKTNMFNGVIVDPCTLPKLADEFGPALSRSVRAWARQGCDVVWLEIPIAQADLIPVAVNAGFVFHHSAPDYLMLVYRLSADAFVPPFASHYIGAGGIVINDRQELLVVWEKAHRSNGRRYYKLPGGTLHQGEHLVDGVIREVEEETGVRTRFESLVCFRHWHGYRFGKSDIYFICRLSPLTRAITIQVSEIAECLWMPVEAYLASEYVGIFNKRIVQTALHAAGALVPTWINGYQSDPAAREIFMPGSGFGSPGAVSTAGLQS